MINSPYVPEPVKIQRIFRHSQDNFSLYVDWPKELGPGQFAQVSVLGIGEAPISFASYGKDYVEFNIHEVGSVTHALSELKEGDEVWVRGPYGKGYPMKELEGNDLIFIGGGCGVAPLKGAIEYVEHNLDKYGDIWLFMGFRSPEDILFENQHENWKKHFQTQMTVDKASEESCYVGDVGYITDTLKRADFTNENKAVFICGPPIMMEKSIEILLEKGFNPDQIFVSAERLMFCAIGRCGACMIRGKYTCKDGPVFRYDEIKDYKTD